MGYVIKLDNTVIGYVAGDEGVLEPMIAVYIENCLLAYDVKVYLGDEVRMRGLYGFRVVGADERRMTIAIKRCIAFNLHRIVEIEEDKLYVIEHDIKNEGGPNYETKSWS